MRQKPRWNGRVLHTARSGVSKWFSAHRRLARLIFQLYTCPYIYVRSTPLHRMRMLFSTVYFQQSFFCVLAKNLDLVQVKLIDLKIGLGKVRLVW